MQHSELGGEAAAIESERSEPKKRCRVAEKAADDTAQMAKWGLLCFESEGPRWMMYPKGGENTKDGGPN